MCGASSVEMTTRPAIHAAVANQSPKDLSVKARETT
jgi:hypothetical protein